MVAWSADQLFNTALTSDGLPITFARVVNGTADKKTYPNDPLYGTQRVISAKYNDGLVPMYFLYLNAGLYTVRLHFSELTADAGLRVFDVQINGAIMVHDVDIFNLAGKFGAAIVLVFDAVQVTRDNVLTIGFVMKQGSVILSGIEVLPYLGSLPETTPRRYFPNLVGAIEQDGDSLSSTLRLKCGRLNDEMSTLGTIDGSSRLWSADAYFSNAWVLAPDTGSMFQYASTTPRVITSPVGTERRWMATNWMSAQDAENDGDPYYPIFYRIPLTPGLYMVTMWFKDTGSILRISDIISNDPWSATALHTHVRGVRTNVVSVGGYQKQVIQVSVQQSSILEAAGQSSKPYGLLKIGLQARVAYPSIAGIEIARGAGQFVSAPATVGALFSLNIICGNIYAGFTDISNVRWSTDVFYTSLTHGHILNVPDSLSTAAVANPALYIYFNQRILNSPTYLSLWEEPEAVKVSTSQSIDSDLCYAVPVPSRQAMYTLEFYFFEASTTAAINSRVFNVKVNNEVLIPKFATTRSRDYANFATTFGSRTIECVEEFLGATHCTVKNFNKQAGDSSIDLTLQRDVGTPLISGFRIVEQSKDVGRRKVRIPDPSTDDIRLVAHRLPAMLTGSFVLAAMSVLVLAFLYRVSSLGKQNGDRTIIADQA